MSFYEKLATVLEKTANVLDLQTREQRSEQEAQRQQMLAVVSEKYAAATGEDLSEEVVEKLAHSDENLLAVMQKLAAQANNTEPDDMGQAVDVDNDKPVYATKKAEYKAEAEQAADNFLNFIME